MPPSEVESHQLLKRDPDTLSISSEDHLHTHTDTDNPTPLPVRRNPSSISKRSLLIHFSLITFYTLTGILYVRAQTPASPTHYNAIPSLDVQRIPLTIPPVNTSEYFGPPSKAMDEAWDELLEQKRIRVSKEELDRLGRESVAMGEGEGGYLAWLGIFHELHCLNFVRKWKWREYYFPDGVSEEVEKRIVGHTDHCLDRIREVLMCQPDVSDLVTMYWDKSPKPMVNGTRILHNCVDWDALIKSTESRRIPRPEMDALKNPRLAEDPS